MLRAEETIFYSIESSIKAYRKFAQARIRKIDPSLTIDQSMLIDTLMANPLITQKELAQLIFKDVASVTRMIELLVKSGFITRKTNPKNRRQNILTATKKSKDILKKLRKTVENNRMEALKDISEKDLKNCKQTLDKILQNITKA